MHMARTPLYTVTTLAAALELSQPQVSQWKSLGMPFSKAGRISMADAVGWLRDRASKDRPRIGVSESQERKAAADAETAELNLAKLKGTLVAASDMRREVEDEALRVRAIVRQMAPNYAPLLAARLSCGLREAFAVLQEVGDEVSRQMARRDAEDVAEPEAA
jgi:phage terminase Nu1 subunit (DNA packaging protein)